MDAVWCAYCKAARPAEVPASPEVSNTDRLAIGVAVVRRGEDAVRSARAPRGGDSETGSTFSRWYLELPEPDHQFDIELHRWSGYPMEMMMRFRNGPERFIGLHRRHTLAVNRHRKRWWSSLRNQSIYNGQAPDHPSKRTPTMEQLSEGSGVDDIPDLVEKLGGRITSRASVGRVRRGQDSAVLVGAEGNEAPHVALFVISRLLPIYREYTG